MRSLRSIVPAALAASMVVLAVGVVAGAPAASASTQCQWQPLSLQNGWQSEQSAWNTGDPAYCIDNGTVYLSGSLAQPSAGSNYVAQLPQQAWPASTMFLSVYTYGGATGIVQIRTDGTIYAYSGKATQFTSLVGISFPEASTAADADNPALRLAVGSEPVGHRGPRLLRQRRRGPPVRLAVSSERHRPRGIRCAATGRQACR